MSKKRDPGFKLDGLMTIGSFVVPETIRALTDEEIDELDDQYDVHKDVFEEDVAIMCLLRTVYDLRTKLATARNP